MIPALAQLSAESIGSWLQVFFWVLGGVAALVVIYKQVAAKPVTGTPQPLIVKGDEEYVPRPEYERDRTEIRQELGRHAAARKSLHEKIEEQGRMIEKAGTKTDLTYAQVQQLDNKMDRVLERLPRNHA